MKIITMLMILGLALFAEYKVGDSMKIFAVSDQFDKSIAIDNNVKIIVLATSKATGKEGHKYFENKPKEFFEKNSIISMSDMSAVPGLVLDWFMMGKFKEYKYQIALLKDDDIAEILPKKEDMLSIIYLDGLKITDIKYVKSAEELEKALAL